MKIKGYEFPKSSFLSVEKDFEIIFDRMLKNSRLQKLLFYNTPDALDRPELTEEERLGLINKNILNVPKLKVDSEVISYVIVGFDNFTENKTNPEFRDNLVFFDIICHFDTWHLNGSKLRPYQIAGELDAMLNNRKLTGIGLLEFQGSSQIVLNDEFAGLTLMYRAVHGSDDQIHPNDQTEEPDIKLNFDKIFNLEQ